MHGSRLPEGVNGFLCFAALIWFAGHGEKGTGNWAFSDGTISFEEVLELYETTSSMEPYTLCVIAVILVPG